MAYEEKKFKDLLIKALNGNKDSYSQFLSLLLPVVEGRVKQKLFNIQNSDDVVQECLMAIHTSLQTYDPERALKPWLFTIINRRLIDYFRKEMTKWDREVAIEGDDDTILGVPSNKLLEGGLELLDKLPENLRGPLILTKVEGQSTEEAAEKLGIGESALRTRVSRAVKMMKKLMEQELYELD